MSIFQIIWWMSLDLAAFTISVLIFLYFRRLIINARMARQGVTRAALQELVYAYLADPAADPSRKFSVVEQRILLGLVTEMMRGITGPMREQLVDFLEKTIDQGRIAHALRNSKAEDRAKFAARLFWSKSPVVHEALREALNDRYPTVVIAAANALISAGQKLSLIDLVPKLEARHMLGHRAVRDIFRKVAPQNVAALIALLDDKDPAVVVLAVDALTRFPNETALNRLARLAGAHPNVDVRATAVRTLGLIGNRAFDHVVLAALSDSAWEVKVQAVIAAGRLRLAGALPALERLVRDSNWWIQLRSAQSLARLGDEGVAVLERLRAEAEYAPVADFALAERHL
jgi:HEAT repeat protein